CNADRQRRERAYEIHHALPAGALLSMPDRRKSSAMQLLLSAKRSPPRPHPEERPKGASRRVEGGPRLAAHPSRRTRFASAPQDEAETGRAVLQLSPRLQRPREPGLFYDLA